MAGLGSLGALSQADVRALEQVVPVERTFICLEGTLQCITLVLHVYLSYAVNDFLCSVVHDEIWVVYIVKNQFFVILINIRLLKRLFKAFRCFEFPLLFVQLPLQLCFSRLKLGNLVLHAFHLVNLIVI